MVKRINHPLACWFLHKNFISLKYEMEDIFPRTLEPDFRYLLYFINEGIFWHGAKQGEWLFWQANIFLTLQFSPKTIHLNHIFNTSQSLPAREFSGMM